MCAGDSSPLCWRLYRKIRNNRADGCGELPDGTTAWDESSLCADGSLVWDGGLVLPPDDRAPVSTEPASASEPAERRRAAWMAAAQAGDRRANESCWPDSVTLVRAAARRQGVGVEALVDVVQETPPTVHRVRHSYDPARFLRCGAQRHGRASCHRCAAQPWPVREARTARRHRVQAALRPRGRTQACMPNAASRRGACARPSRNCRAAFAAAADLLTHALALLIAVAANAAMGERLLSR